jgi:hypothetical protein
MLSTKIQQVSIVEMTNLLAYIDQLEEESERILLTQWQSKSYVRSF